MSRDGVVGGYVANVKGEMIPLMWNDTPFTRRLGLRYPIVQGPFGGGFSTARLTATVSNAGGLGSFGAQGQPPERMSEIVGEIRKLTAAPFAVNLWVSTDDEGAKNVSRERYDAALRPLAPLLEELGVPAGGVSVRRVALVRRSGGRADRGAAADHQLHLRHSSR